MKGRFVALLLLAACDPGGADPSWRIADDPELTVGGVAGDSAVDLSRVLGAVRLADGSLIVANGATSELRWFDPSGRPVRSVGRSGADRIGLMSAVFLQGDTVLVWDGRERRLTRWAPAGTLLGARRVALADTTRAVTLRGAMGGEVLLAESSTAIVVPDSQGVVQPVGGLFRIDGAGHADSIGFVPGDELFVKRAGGAASIMRLPFGCVTVVLARPGGYLVARGEAPEIADHDADGTLRRMIRWRATRAPVTTADEERHLRLLLGAARTGSQASGIRQLWAAMPLPDSFPYVTTMVRDPSALVWVREPAHLADSTATWQVIGADGTSLGALALPAGATPLHVGPDRVVLHVVDADGVERLQVHRLRRPKAT